MARAIRNFKQATLLALAAVAAAMAATGCAKSGGGSPEVADAVEVSSKEITLADYSSRRAIVDVPPGNRNAAISWETLYVNLPGEMPEVVPDGLGGMVMKKPGTSTKKTFNAWMNDPIGLRAELETRFNGAITKLNRRDKAVRAELVKAAQIYGVDPILVISCILGEHTFNVGMTDWAQDQYVQARQWADKWATRFVNNKVNLVDLLQRPEFEECAAPVRAGGSQYDFWLCADRVWMKSFRGKFTDATKTARFPYESFKYAFFNPLSSGYTYGLGQLDPIRALMVTDLVHAKSGLRFLSVERPYEIYEDIINEMTSMHYLTANVALILKVYRDKAGFDLSKNPGLISTLYNLGGEGGRAQELYTRNLKALKNGVIYMPMENYAGFFVNEHESRIRQAFANWR